MKSREQQQELQRRQTMVGQQRQIIWQKETTHVPYALSVHATQYSRVADTCAPVLSAQAISTDVPYVAPSPKQSVCIDRPLDVRYVCHALFA